MSDLGFETVFPMFADLSSDQPYDDPENGADGVDRLTKSYLEQLEDRQDNAEIAAQVRMLLAEIEGALDAFVPQVFPPETATSNADYVAEDADRAVVSVKGQTAALHSDTPVPDLAFRVSNTTLEQSFQAILDHLTTARIAEEMDAPTYLERMRGAFRRAADGARAQSSTFKTYCSLARRYTIRIGLLDRVLQVMQDQVLPQLSTTADAELAAQVEAVSKMHGKAFVLATHYEKFVQLSATSMTRAREEFASESNRAGAESESLQVSRQVELSALYRPLPILWAVLVTFLVKIVLAHNTSEVLHAVAIPLLILTFVATWLFSIQIGVTARVRRMRALRSHVQMQLRNVLAIEPPKSPALLTSWANDEALIEFPTVTADFVAPPPMPIQAYNSRRLAASQKLQIAQLNLIALIIPLFLAIIVFITRTEDGYEYVARFEASDACILASGRLVFATNDTYFVVPDGRANTPLKRGLSFVFPELLADEIKRETVVRVRDRSEKNELELRNCLAPGSGNDSLRVIHEGNAFGGQSTVTQITNRADALIAALNAPRPINLDLGEAGDEGRLSLTVNLGDTSLDVLTQAIATSGGGFGAAVTDPVIINARTDIELELSKQPPSEIDINKILSALNIISVQLGGDTTVAQALNVVFGAPQLTSKIELDSDIRTILEGGGGEGGLLEVLTRLQEELGVSNTLATQFLALLALEENDKTIVTVLNESLTSIVERQDAFIAAVSTAIETNKTDAFVVTPTIIGNGGAISPSPPVLNGDGDSVFQTFVVMGSDATSEPISVADTLVLPFWPTPVSSEQGLVSPQTVFDWGSDPENLIDPSVTNDGQTYFGRIAKTLRDCLANDAEVELDVLGLASRSWGGDVDDASSEAELNYYLAEARRTAALRLLSNLLNDRDLDLDLDLERRILIQIADETLLPLSDLIAIAERAEAIEDILPEFSRFESASTFETRRDTLLNVTGLDPDKATPLEELFGRSVVLRVLHARGGPCAF